MSRWAVLVLATNACATVLAVILEVPNRWLFGAYVMGAIMGAVTGSVHGLFQFVWSIEPDRE